MGIMLFRLPSGQEYEFQDHLDPQEMQKFVEKDLGGPLPEGTEFMSGDEASAAIYSPGNLNLGEMQTEQITSSETGESIGRGVIETAGVLGGGSAGLALGGPGGAYAGGVAGYVGGKRTGNLLYGTPQDSLMQDIAEGGVYAGIDPALKGIGAAGKSLVGRALKIPPTKANIAVRSKAAQSFIAENLGISQRGLMKAVKNIDELDNAVKSAINSASSGGAEIDTIALEIALDKLKPRFANRLNPKDYYHVIDQVKGEILTHPSVVNGRIPLNKAHELKKGIYKELDSFYTGMQGLTPPAAKLAQTESIAKAAVANSLRDAILSHPDVPAEVAKQLSREAGLVNIKKWLQRAAARAGNHDIITFNDVLLGSLVKTGIPEAVGARFLRSPRIQARIGIMFSQLAKHRKSIQAGVVATRPASYLSNPHKP